MRRLAPGDPGAASVDEIESTTMPTAYPHPDNANLLFWDVPATVLTQIREECNNHLNNEKIYLISTCLAHVRLWDFERLTNDLIDMYPVEKRHAITLAMSAAGRLAIQKKRDHYLIAVSRYDSRYAIVGLSAGMKNLQAQLTGTLKPREQVTANRFTDDKSAEKPPESTRFIAD
ncbi:unnamed protein product [Didymodactylos carnosus]|uniref:Uncharacterized protein n=1 Tax=Didymodactylos carnosus TaxID=1234261 RepID=A0A814FAB5_9BILA|nr:unnamed protein product [Didymodactylos carnosus]CAF0980265.1 unnamed protein product [Didymodactylos carnosus]CAF3686840.1 unnamed protein product [Didymodactylos carnosus]CAF3752819.1 unnamed protein product [Didymodactylos carnosus]